MSVEQEIRAILKEYRWEASGWEMGKVLADFVTASNKETRIDEVEDLLETIKGKRDFANKTGNVFDGSDIIEFIEDDLAELKSQRKEAL